MTIYIEVIFLSNLLIDVFLIVVSLSVLGAKIRMTRVILSAAIGGFFSAIYPFVGRYQILLKILCGAIMPIIFRKNYKFKEYLASLTVFFAVTMILGGIVLSLTTFLSDKITYNSLTYGTFPILISASGTVAILLYSYLKRELKREIRKSDNFYDVKIYNSSGACDCRAFYDSGNRVYTKNGERVVIVGEDVYNKLMPAEVETIGVATPNGVSEMEITDARLVIYLRNGENKIYKVKAGRSALILGEAQLILHSEMMGE